MSENLFKVSERRYDWVEILRYASAGLSEGKTVEEILEGIRAVCDGDWTTRTVDWARRCVDAIENRNPEEFRKQFNTRTQEDRALAVFFPRLNFVSRKVERKAKNDSSKDHQQGKWNYRKGFRFRKTNDWGIRGTEVEYFIPKPSEPLTEK